MGPEDKPKSLFDYPFSVPTDTAYAFFGIGPEATSDEIRDARVRVVRDIEDAKRRMEEQIAAIEHSVPGLVEAREVVERAAGGSRSRDVQEARRRLPQLEHQAIQADPQYHYLRNRRDELGKLEADINALPILYEEQRHIYDRHHPPLELFKIERCVADPFADRATTLALVREELSRFFEERGEEVFHPTDLTRRDFSGDFDHNPILDGGCDEPR